MKQLTIVALMLLVAIAGCTQKPAPMASGTAASDPADRMAIAVEYVSIPKAIVFARPADDATAVGAFAMMEAVSILEKDGDWCLVRMFEGTGWMKQTDLIDGETAESFDTLTPRFYVEPLKIPQRARGEIWLQARVNTDGSVIDVQAVKNTTGSTKLAEANAEALKMAQFYPVIDKGSRKTFVYQHRVYY